MYLKAFGFLPSKKETTRTKNIAIEDITKTLFHNKDNFGFCEDPKGTYWAHFRSTSKQLI